MNAADRKQAKRLYDGLCSKCRPSAQSFLAKQVRKAFKPMKKARLEKEKEKQLSKKEETARIREACMKRANGACECGCGRPLRAGSFAFKPEMDEWENGNGRRQQRRAVETCWILASVCHIWRQQYIPTVALWNRLRKAFCEKHGYQFVPHIEHAPLPSSTPSVPAADTPLPDKGIGGVDSKQEQLSEKGKVNGEI